jgi:hypothetical protein
MSDINLYKPNPQITAIFDVDETMADNELSFDLFKKIVTARKTEEVLYLALGKMLKVFRDRKLYKQLDFENMSQFLSSEEISFSREKAYMLIRIYEYYTEYLQLGEDDMKDYPVARLSLIMPVLKQMDNKEDQIKELERVKQLRYGDFIRDVKSHLNKDGKPAVYWSNESNKWVVNYYDNTSVLMSLGEFEGGQNEQTEGVS